MHQIKRPRPPQGGLIGAIQPASIAAELGLQPGAEVLAVGQTILRDLIDYQFATAEEQIELYVRQGSETIIYEIQKDPDEDLGITFENPLFEPIRRCNNQCLFCFVAQMPPQMRKTLYIKDDDYRLSFLYGSFITLTNLREADWERIITHHLSPLHISVHATDPKIRALLLGRARVPDLLASIQRLGAAGIQVHTQIVACPGLNDGAVLQNTIEDLSNLYPTVQSIAVVPVGLTRYHCFPKNAKNPSNEKDSERCQSLPKAAKIPFCARLPANSALALRCYTPSEAAQVLDLIQPYSQRYRRSLGCGLVYPSDEFFLVSGRGLPKASFYDGYPQYTNGVGMTREFLESWTKEARKLPQTLPGSFKLALVCGTLIATTLQILAERLNKIGGLEVSVLALENTFFGSTVTVSGLLTGQDVAAGLRATASTQALLPRVMFDHQGLRTLDDYTPQSLAQASGVALTIIDGPRELVRFIQNLAAPEALNSAEQNGSESRGSNDS